MIFQVKSVQGPVFAPFEGGIGMGAEAAAQRGVRDSRIGRQGEREFGSLDLDVRRLMTGSQGASLVELFCRKGWLILGWRAGHSRAPLAKMEPSLVANFIFGNAGTPHELSESTT